MVPQAAILVGVGLFGVFFAVAAYHAWEQQQRQHRYQDQEPLPRRSSTPRPVMLGPCGICGWEVLNEMSYRLPCNHYSHPTCAADIKLSRGHPTFNLADVCRNCVKSRVKKNMSTRVQKNERPVVLGSCGICGRDVLNESYPLPCNHHSHSTCAADIKRSSQGHPTFNLADVCRNCVKSRVKKNMSTRVQKNERPVVLGSCGICGRDVLNESYPLPCNHHSHSKCAADIKRSSQGHPTFNLADVCRNCVKSRVEKDASTRVQKNEGLRNRGTSGQICADCREAFVDNRETQQLDCKHRVHKTCWGEIATSGFTTCPLCMDDE